MDWSQISWSGYARRNGSKGIRNKLLVVYTVECSSFVARRVALLADSPDVEVIGFYGCADNEYAVRLLISLIRHPNVGAVLAIGLGCEYVQPEWLADIAVREGKAAAWFSIQAEGGTEKSVARGLAEVERLRRALAEVPRVEMRAADLVVGAECGGSDYTSGLAGNVVAGRFFDLLVDAGGTAIFEEIVEAIGLVDMLCARAADGRAEAELRHAYVKALAYCNAVRQYSVSPGNFAGGLSSIEEKSMGALAKSGSRPIRGVLKVGGTPPAGGLWLLDTTPDPHWMQFGITNPNDNEGLTALASCGCHLLFLITGRGNVVGNAVAPVVKITGNAETFARMKDDMDFDASPVIAGRTGMGALAESLADMVVGVASGKQTHAERLGHCEYCVPYKYQDKRAGPACRGEGSSDDV